MASVSTTPDPMAGRLEGTVLGDRYSLQRRIAAGGMGQVWEATDRILGRNVAVKILRDDLVESPEFLERFRAEARHTAALAHHGIASVYDYAEERHGGTCIAYLVMELVDGETLSKVIVERAPLPAASAIAMLAQAAEALHAAHTKGVVHRDVKPGNLLLLADGTVKVTDFGIARAIDGEPMTAVGQVIGTVGYISPEQAQGRGATPASDVYSLGVIGYELLSGHPPFAGDAPDALAAAHAHDQPPPLPPSVPAPLAALIEATLSKDPARRPGDAGELAAELRRIDADPVDAAVTRVQPEAVAPTVTMEAAAPTAMMPADRVVRRATPSPRRIRRWMLAAGVAVIAVLLLLAIASAGSHDPLDVTPTTTVAPPPTTTPPTVAPSVAVVIPATTAQSPARDHKPKKHDGKGKGGGG